MRRAEQVKKKEPKPPVVKIPRKKAPGKIPDKLSDAILVSLSDLEKSEKDKTVSVDMTFWVKKGNDGLCHVCLAGSLMLGTMGLTREEVNNQILNDIDRIDETSRHRLFAIDVSRSGHFPSSWIKAYKASEKDVQRFIDNETDDHHVINKGDGVVPYEVNRKSFKIDMKNYAARLKKYNL